MPKPPEELRKALSLYCKGKARAYRVDTTKGKLELKLFHRQKGLIKADFKLREAEQVVREFIGKHPGNKSVFWFLYGGEMAYRFTTHDFERIADAGFPGDKAVMRVMPKYENRRFGTLFLKLALDHHEQTHKTVITDVVATNEPGYRIAKKLGYKDYTEKGAKRRVVY